MKRVNFTQEELKRAKEVSLSKVAENLGYHVYRKGIYLSIKEMDSIIIYNDKTWYRWSGQGVKTGGSQIDFVMEFANKNLVEAVDYLLELDGNNFRENITQSDKAVHVSGHKEKNDFVLPEKSKTGFKRLYAYLIQNRKISKEVVDYFVIHKLIYETELHHNIVFVGYDKNGKERFASMRGTQDNLGYVFKGDVPGNDKNFGVNIVNKSSKEVNVFEAAIDLMSYCTLSGDISETNKIALGMVSDNPLNTFLKENPEVKKINLWLDNDAAGRKGAAAIRDKYSAMGYEVTDNVVPMGKDMNEYLQIVKSSPNLLNRKGR